MDWRPVRGVPRLSPNDGWDRLQPPCDPTVGLSGYRSWNQLRYHQLVDWPVLRGFTAGSIDALNENVSC